MVFGDMKFYTIAQAISRGTGAYACIATACNAEIATVMIFLDGMPPLRHPMNSPTRLCKPCSCQARSYW